jgi:amino acid adenylation domain-containing protein
MSPLKTLEVTPTQHKLLVQHRLFPEDGAFNLAFAFRIGDGLDVQRLTASVSLVLESCVALNTTFVDGDGGPRAVVAAHNGAGPGRRSLGGHADPGSEAADVQRWLSNRADQPIAPERWPLYDVTIHLGDHGTYLTVLCSHLVGDAYSAYHMIELFDRLYRDPGSWDDVRTSLAVDPASVVEPPSDRGVDAFRALLGDVSTLTHEALAPERTPGGAIHGRHERIELDDDVAAALRSSSLIERHRAFPVFLSAYAVVLSALTGRRDVVIGVPVANRRGRAQREAFGYFVNTLPLPVDLSAHETFDDLCAAVAEKVFVLLRNQDFDLTQHAHEVLGGARSGPLAVDNGFTYYKQELAPKIGDCEVEPLEVPRRLLKVPFSMIVEDRGDRYAVSLEYIPRLAAADPAACVSHVLRTISADGEVPLRELAVVDSTRAARIDALLNTRKDYDVPPSLDAWFAATARAMGDRAALTDAAGETTYEELDALAGRVASTLRADAPGDAVAVAMHRRRDLVAVILGALRAGKAFVPIDPAAPVERVRHIVAQFPDLVLVADPGVLRDLEDVRRLDAADVLAGSGEPERSALAHWPHDRRDDAAYVVFTSGSTGAPKGVEVTHRNVMRLYRSFEERFDFGADDTWSLFHSYAFDMGISEMFGALLYGGRLVIVPELEARSPAEFAELLVREQVTVLIQTPSGFRQLTKVLSPEQAERIAVRSVWLGGEALHLEVLRPWLDAVGDRARILNLYGPTETTMFVTHHEVVPERVGVERDSVIGRPLGDASVHVVDDNLNPCPLGVAGELLVGGAGVATGYRSRPDLTEQRFLRGTRYGDVVYRTGDMGFVRPDGNIVYLGRIDKQIQLRGYRIELGEVEGALMAVPGMLECFVQLDEQAAEPRLVAYVVGASVPSDDEIRATLARRIPAYMVPALFVRMAELPLTINGKLDETRLPRPDATPAAVVVVDDDDDELATAIARMWAETIEGGAVHTSGNFFDAGGTSMHVAEAYHRLVTEFGAADIAMVELFEYPTPKALADRIRRSEPSKSAPAAPARPARPARSRPARRPAVSQHTS